MDGVNSGDIFTIFAYLVIIFILIVIGVSCFNIQRDIRFIRKEYQRLSLKFLSEEDSTIEKYGESTLSQSSKSEIRIHKPLGGPSIFG